MDTELKDEFREMIVGMKTFLELQTRHVERLESLLAHHAPVEGQALPVQPLEPHLDKTTRGSNSDHRLTEDGQSTSSSSLEVTSQGNSSHPNEDDESHDDGSVTEHFRPTTSLSVKSAMVDILLNGKPIESLVSEDDVKTLFYSSPEVGTVPFRSAEISPHPSPVSARPEHDSRVVGWNYWRPYVHNYRYWTGRGRPNYLPEWELTYIADKWYHIDNPSEPLANFDGNFPAERYVPYSHSPPVGMERLARVGLDDAATKRIREVLGQLYSVPPDSRVLLTFERNELRLAHEENRLEKYLTDVGALFTELASAEGWFRVVDCDDFMNHTTYSYKNKMPSSGISDISQGGLATHCLNAEEFDLDIPPARLQIDVDRPISWSESHTLRQWHRLSAATSWDEIAIIMEDLLDEGDVILNSQKHDSLLFDDNTFSRSRRYFWAVDCLGTFHASISDTLDQWNMWWEAWEPIMRNCEIVHTARIAARRRRDPVPGDHFNASGKSISLPLEEINRQVRRLEGLKGAFQARLQKTQTLREALFSASSVMESREATDLGKTVKLLTYVSIFYLPLGVCAGMFSIDPDFGLTLFGIVTLVTAVTTYFLVANLENILSVLRKTPHPIRNPFVDKMAQDVDEEWKKKGQDLKDAPPERVDTTPSEWRIIQYAGIRVARVFGRLTRRRKAPEDELP